jgi:predicted lipoprotein with Yx(FWY)xxD motif
MKRSVLVLAALVVAASLAVGLGAASAANHASGSAATVGTATSSLGRILVDSQGRTLYLFEADKAGRSVCNGACAQYWPPLLTKSKPVAKGAVKKSLLGVTRRRNGTMQVTYAGHPLYRFVQDTKPGQTSGQGLNLSGGEWYVLSAAGKKIEHASAKSDDSGSAAVGSTTAGSPGGQDDSGGGYGY